MDFLTHPSPSVAHWHYAYKCATERVTSRHVIYRVAQKSGTVFVEPHNSVKY